MSCCMGRLCEKIKCFRMKSVFNIKFPSRLMEGRVLTRGFMTKNRARRVAILGRSWMWVKPERRKKKRERNRKKKKDKGSMGEKGEKLGPPINDQIMGSLDTHPHMAAAELFRSMMLFLATACLAHSAVISIFPWWFQGNRLYFFSFLFSSSSRFG